MPDTAQDSQIYKHPDYVFPSGVPVRVPLKQPSKRGSQRSGLESIADDDIRGSVIGPEGIDLERQVCQECERDDSNGWPDRRGRYWCSPCWSKWNQQRQWTDEQALADA